jgi:hypothetical protein
LDLQATLERQRGALNVSLEGSVGAWGTAEPATGCLVTDVATERDALIADLALRHGNSSSGDGLPTQLSCDTLMKDNTIHTHLMQTRQAEVGQIWLSTPVIAKFIIAQLQHMPSVIGVGKSAVPLNHPDAWQQIAVHRADALEVPLVIVDTVALAPTVDAVTDNLTTAVSRWCGMAVAVDVAVVRVAPASSTHPA